MLHLPFLDGNVDIDLSVSGEISYKFDSLDIVLTGKVLVKGLQTEEIADVIREILTNEWQQAVEEGIKNGELTVH